MKIIFSKLLPLTVAFALIITACTAKATEVPYEEFDPANFDNPSKITNPFMPMTPGMKYTFDGETVEDDGTLVPHQVVIHITDLTKVISGIRSMVSWDLDYSDGELVEAELAFYAQDNDGTVWRMGEFPVEYDGTDIIGAPTWIHGIQDARAGIMMQTNPQIGTPSYAQGWGPAVDWNDRGKVDQINQETCVPVDCYKGVLVIAETSASEPDAEQLKYYAPGVGNVRVGWRGGGEKTKETLELVKIEQLDEATLADVRRQALELEKIAYKVSKDVYGLTQPMESPTSTDATLNQMKNIETVSIPSEKPQEPPDEIVVYAADIPDNALFELEIWENAGSPVGKMIGLINNGDELDPPPENDPNATFDIEVQSGIPYRCWIHMKVGTPMGKSQANRLFVAFSDALDEDGQPAFKIRSKSFLTVQGPSKEGWGWVGCDQSGEPALIYFQNNGITTVRIQAGMEGVGFDQFLLSSDEYLEFSPTKAIVEK